MTIDNKIMQVGEISDHLYFIGSQFHPEFTSRALKPNPMFNGFIQACILKRKIKVESNITAN